MSSENPGRQREAARIGSWNSPSTGPNKESFLRVAVIHYDTENSKTFDEIVKGLAKGIESQGHDVTLVDAKRDAGKSLTSFGYIAVGSSAPSLFAKSVPVPLGSFLRSAGMVSGKRCYAFVGKKGLRKGKVLASLMRIMGERGHVFKKIRYHRQLGGGLCRRFAASYRAPTRLI
jgi:hypothetical protein